MKTMNRLYLASAALALIMLSACGGEEAPTGPKYNFERAEKLPDGYLEELGIIKTNIEAIIIKIISIIKLICIFFVKNL